MFKIVVNGRNIALTEAIKNYVTEKLQRLDHHFDFIQEVHIFLSVQKNPSIKKNQQAEATVHVSHAVIRVEVSSDDMYGSIDALVDKVDRSLQKHKTKLLHRAKSAKGESIRRAGFDQNVAEETTADHHDDELGDEVFLTFVEEEETVPSH